MKMRSRIIAVLGILILCAGLFVACNSEVSESSAVDTSKTAYLSFGNGLSKAIDATSIGQEYEIISVNDVYWLYTATKKDNAGTTGAKTDMTPVKSDFTKGLDGVIGPMSVGKWEFKLEGYKAVEDSAPSSGSYKEVTIGQVTKYYWASEKIYDGSSAIITLSENTASNPQVVSVDIVFAGTGDGTIVIRKGEFYWVDDNGGDVALDNNMFRIHLTLSQDSVEKYDVYFNLIAESYSVGTETKIRYVLADTAANSFNAASGDYNATFAVEKWSVSNNEPVERVGYVSGASDVSVTVYAQQILDIDSQFLESVFGYVTFDGITPSPVLVQRLVLKTDTTSLTVSETQTITHDGLSVTYPDGTKLSEGTKEAEDGKTADATTGFVYTSSEPSSGSVVVGNDDAVMQYALTLNVDVTNTTVLTVTRNIGTGRDIQSVYHNGNLMTIASGSGDPVADTYSYNSATGILTLYVNHASPIDVVYRPAVSTDVAKIVRSEKTYLFASLEEAVDVAEANETIILLNDTNADVTVDKVITIDLNGKNYGGTITVATTGTNAVTVIGDANVDAIIKYGNKYFNAFVTVNNGTVTLLKNITMSSFEVSPGYNKTIDLNNHIITFTGSYSDGALRVYSDDDGGTGGTLNLSNGRLRFTGTGSSNSGVYVMGNLNCNNVIIDSSESTLGYAVYVQNSRSTVPAEFTMTGGQIISNACAVYEYGYKAYSFVTYKSVAYPQNMNLNGVTITSTTDSIQICGSNAVIESCSITSQSGHGIYIQGMSGVTPAAVSEVTITGSTSIRTVGSGHNGICAKAGSTFAISGNVVVEVETDSDAVEVGYSAVGGNGSVSISAGTFIGNLDQQTGGTIVITGGVFTCDPTNFVDTENFDVIYDANTSTWTVTEKTILSTPI